MVGPKSISKQELIKEFNTMPKSQKTGKMPKTNKISIAKPFLKWVGGKTQIIGTITELIPTKMNNYHEFFLGGGSVLLAVLSLQAENKYEITGKIYAYDLNETLITVYKNIQSHKDELYKYITEYIELYNECTGTIINRKPKNLNEATTSKESFYYWMRHLYNTMTKDASKLRRSALFMVINKTCFRGMYREGPNGFNIPYGHYKKTPTMITEDYLNYISKLIQPVEFICCDFKDAFKNVKSGDFVYMDPPYAPENKKSFVAYTKNGFNLETHNKLFKLTDELNDKDIKFMMNNAKVKLVVDHFSKYKITDILCRRAIHSKNPGAKAMEVIIMNY